MATYTTAKKDLVTTTGVGDDIIDGGDFSTKIFAGNGTNLVRTGKEADSIFAGTGKDFIDAGDGDNTIGSGDGDNSILTGKGNDRVVIGTGNSNVYTDGGDDIIVALNGRSIINAGIGKDLIGLGKGNNRIVLEAGIGDVTITGFDVKTDKLRLGESLAGKTLTFTAKGSDTLVAAGEDLLATLKGVATASDAVIDTTPLTRYEATDLGSLNTTNLNANVNAAAINNFGQIGGRYDTAGTFINENATTAVLNTANIIRQGFVWEKGKLTALTNVGPKKGQSDLGAPSGTTINMLVPNVRNISDRGLVLGTVDEVRQPIPAATDRALIWEKGETTPYKLTINDFGGLESYFYDANTSNQIAGKNILSNGYEKPLVFENGAVIELGALGGDGGTAQGINNKGQLVGTIDSDGNLNDTFVNTAVLWEKTKGAYELKNLGTFGAAQASLRDINDAGQIIGAKSNGLSGTAAVTNPFILFDKNKDGKYTNDELTDLGSLGGKTGSVGAVNAFGTVVGASQLADGTSHAYVWNNGKMADLNTLVSKAITYNGAAVTLTNALGINDFGDIVATGTYTYKDAAGKNATGTRSYELKGIANNSAAAITAPLVVLPSAVVAGGTGTATTTGTGTGMTTGTTTTGTVAGAVTGTGTGTTGAGTVAGAATGTGTPVTGTGMTSAPTTPIDTTGVAQLLATGGISDLTKVDAILSKIDALFCDIQQFQSLSSSTMT